MVEFTPGVSMAWAVAAREVEKIQQEFIEKEEILIGICSLEKIDVPREWIPDEMKGLITSESLEKIKNENIIIKSIFDDLFLDLSYFRRKLRFKVIYVPEDRPYRKITDMSLECRRCFNRAREIAEREGFEEASCIHLLIAILEQIIEDPQQAAYEALRDYNLTSIKEIAYSRMEYAKQLLENKPNEPQETPIPEPTYYDDYNTPILNTCGTDLTKMAREGSLDPLIGRDEEVLQLIRTLSRKKKNNPLIIGEAGVGKTALVRGLASKIAQNKVPHNLRNKRIVEIDMGNMVAGTMYRGQFEEKLTNILRELKENKNVIVFIDEIHTVIGAGSCEGSNQDASDIMKPALAQGDICCIGATTISEFRKYFRERFRHRTTIPAHKG